MPRRSARRSWRPPSWTSWRPARKGQRGHRGHFALDVGGGGEPGQPWRAAGLGPIILSLRGRPRGTRCRVGATRDRPLVAVALLIKRLRLVESKDGGAQGLKNGADGRLEVLPTAPGPPGGPGPRRSQGVALNGIISAPAYDARAKRTHAPPNTRARARTHARKHSGLALLSFPRCLRPRVFPRCLHKVSLSCLGHPVFPRRPELATGIQCSGSIVHMLTRLFLNSLS